MSRPLVASAALLTAALLLITSCRPGDGGSSGSNAGQSSSPDGGLVVVVEVEGSSIGSAPVTVRVRDDGAEVSGAAVEVQGTMTHAGMVPVIAGALEVEAGVYRSESFAFTMAGDWIVTASVTTPDGHEAEADTFVNVGR